MSSLGRRVSRASGLCNLTEEHLVCVGCGRSVKEARVEAQQLKNLQGTAKTLMELIECFARQRAVLEAENFKMRCFRAWAQLKKEAELPFSISHRDNEVRWQQTSCQLQQIYWMQAVNQQQNASRDVQNHVVKLPESMSSQESKLTCCYTDPWEVQGEWHAQHIDWKDITQRQFGMHTSKNDAHSLKNLQASVLHSKGYTTVEDVTEQSPSGQQQKSTLEAQSTGKVMEEGTLLKPANSRDANTVPLDSKHLCKLLVPVRVLGSFKGKNGSTVRAMELESKCKIEISKENFPGTHDRVCGIVGNTADDLEQALIRTINIFGQITRDATHMVLKLVVPRSAASQIIGKEGKIIQRLTTNTGCSVRVTTRVEGFQERLVIIGGGESQVKDAAVQLVRTIQASKHLEQNMLLTYEQQLPLGSWSGQAPSDPSEPLLTQEEAKTKMKREIIEYLRKAAPRSLLVRRSLLGSMSNTMKTSKLAELLEAVEETWQMRSKRVEGIACPRDISLATLSRHPEDS